MRTPILFLAVFLLLMSTVTVTAGSENQSFFGQSPTGDEPITFATEALASGYRLHGALNFSPDGREIYWSVMTGEGMKVAVCVSTFDGKLLAKASIAEFAAGRDFSGAAISPDGKRLFVNGKLPLEGDTTKSAMAIFYVERIATGWSKPVPIESTIDTLINKGQVSVARSGNIYFGGRVLSERTPAIFICRYKNGAYSRPEKLTGAIATLPLAADPWVDPEERFLLMSCPPAEGPPMLTDIGVSVRQADGTWAAPARVGGTVNMPDAFERFPSLSPDGKYLFFIRSVGRQFVSDQASFYWVDAGLLDSLVR